MKLKKNLELNEYARLGGVEVDLKVITRGEHRRDYNRAILPLPT